MWSEQGKIGLASFDMLKNVPSAGVFDVFQLTVRVLE